MAMPIMFENLQQKVFTRTKEQAALCPNPADGSESNKCHGVGIARRNERPTKDWTDLLGVTHHVETALLVIVAR